MRANKTTEAGRGTSSSAAGPGWRTACLTLSAWLLLTACTTTEPAPEPQPRLPAPTEDSSLLDGVIATADSQFSNQGPMDEELFPGSDVFIDEEAAALRPKPVTANGEIVLNFEGESIQSVVHTILGEVLQETFVIAPGVSGQVTFATSKPVSREQLMPILELLLTWNGATLVFHEGRYHVLPVDDAIRGHLVPRIGSADQAKGYEVRAVPLKFISAAEMAKILEPYARTNAILNVDPVRNMIFVAGTREELSNYLQTVEIFDVDWLAGMSVGIYPLYTVDVESITSELSAIFGTEAEGPMTGLFRFVPLERLGSIMVITPREEYLETARVWIERLDRGAAGSGSQLFVYRVKNLEAQVLANYLTSLFGGTQAESSRERPTNLAPGLQPVTRSSVTGFNANRQQANQRGLPQERPEQGSGNNVIDSEQGEIRITSVLETNSLLIQATPSQYSSIQAAISRIDEEPLQVMIESQVLDVELNEQLKYGVNWFLSNNPALVPPTAGEAFDEVTIAGGILGTLTDYISGDSTLIRATITALDQVTDVRSIAAPLLVVRNNAQASITVGTQVPVQSSSIDSGGNGNVISSAQYVSTGVTLTVTPRINPGGLVYMDITQEVSRPGAIDPSLSSSGNPPISNKTVTSQVAVQSGQTIVLGGLIGEQDSRGTSGIPYLNRIPVFGALFGGKSTVKTRTETVVMLTPTVLNNSADLEAVTDDLRDEFMQIRPLKIHTLQD